MDGNSPRLIALTGYGQPEDRKRALEAGFDHHLAKPVKADDLSRLLQAAANAEQPDTA
jgi:CheY-like chemotaxis protein